MRFRHIPLILLVLACVNCHPGPVVGTGLKLPVGGTVAGIVSTDTKSAVVGRKVTAVDVASGAKFDATTGANGGFTIKVPEGRYRLEIELLPGETVAKQPAETRINRSDLDPHRDFVIAGVRAVPKRP
jgi:Carboxypeptidase regulatory-like domain